MTIGWDWRRGNRTGSLAPAAEGEGRGGETKKNEELAGQELTITSRELTRPTENSQRPPGARPSASDRPSGGVARSDFSLCEFLASNSRLFSLILGFLGNYRTSLAGC